MALIWKFKNKDYIATPITIGDWELLGSHLKGYLLGDLKFIEDIEGRLQAQAWIQMRDYDIDDVRRHWGRKDMRYKVTLIMFKTETKVNDALISEFEKDYETFDLFRKEVLKASGVTFIEVLVPPSNGKKDEVQNQENPPAPQPPCKGEEEDLAESE